VGEEAFLSWSDRVRREKDRGWCRGEEATDHTRNPASKGSSCVSGNLTVNFNLS
jgi:hypothetical protein